MKRNATIANAALVALALAAPATAAETSKAALGHALSFCAETLSAQKFDPVSLEANGFATEQTAIGPFIGTKETADANVRVYLRSTKTLRKCFIEALPKAPDGDTRASMTDSLLSWAKSRKGAFLPMGSGRAKLLVNTLTLDVRMTSKKFRQSMSAEIEITRQK